MYTSTRFFLYIGGRGSGGPAAAAAGGSSKSDYATSEGVADAFHSVFHRTAWNFDHVLVDIPSIIQSVAFMSRDLVGHERDRETVRNAQRQLQAVILRRLQPRKSLALLFDGSEPLWMTERTRLFGGRRYDSKFFRSCASPMPHLLEEKVRATAMELRMPPWETMISGPATPGLSEGKMSAYLLDLATRVLRPPSHPSGLCPAVSANDTMCVVGAPELAWMGLGVTPFHNITTATLQQGELTCCSLQEMMEWLRLGHLMAPPAEGIQGHSGTSKEDVEVQQQQQQQRLAAVRTDVVFLHLLTNGHSATGLPQVLATPFSNVLDAYRETEAEQAQKNYSSATAAAEGNPARFRSLLFDEEPVTLAHLDRPSLRLRLSSLQRLLVRVYQALSSGTAGIPSNAKPTPHATTLLTWALQAHGLLCSGGVPSPCWTPTPDSKGNTCIGGMSGSASSSEGLGDGSVNSSPGAAGTAMLDKYPKLALEQVIQHVGYLIQRSAAARDAPEPYLCPPRSRSFGLTGVESLLMTATQPDMINQILPLYVRGHTLPDAVAKEITSTRNVHEALRKTQQVVGIVVEQAKRELAARVASPPPARDASGDAAGSAPHPALTHLPSHHFVRAMGSAGPPAGWTYYGVHLGMKAEAMNVRYGLNASDTATLRVIDSTALHPRNALFLWAARGSAEAEGSWIPVACASDTRKATGEGTPVPTAPAPAGAAEAVSTLRVLTWNSQFNRHSGKETPLGRVGIDWCTPTRYVAASHVLAAAEADIICLQEVEPGWAAYLCAQPWVRGGYAVTALESSPALTPYGVLFLVRRGVGTVTRVRETNLPGSTGQVRTMPELTLRVGRGVAPIVVSGLHLLAPYSQANETNRLSQLQRLEADLEKQTWRPPAPVSAEDGPTTAATATSTAAASSTTPTATDTAAAAESVDTEASHILLGDFNDYPAKPYRLPPALSYRDAWEQLHPTCHRSTATAAERGFTIDGLSNPYTAKIIEQKFFGRPDRILYRSKQLQPIAAELVGTTAVTAVLTHAASTAEGPLMQVDKPAEAVPDYLYPSDHFGVLVEFQLV